MNFREDTLCGLFHAKALEYGASRPFLMGRFDHNGDPANDYRELTWKEVRQQSLEFASGLMALGIGKGDKVAIFSESRPRWVIADQAIQAVGAVEVPLYPTTSQEELLYMVENSETKAIICSTVDKAEMSRKVRPETGLTTIITMESWPGERDKGEYHFNEVMDLGRKDFDLSKLEQSIDSAKPEDIVSIIYTSGTTGRPKGAVLTHANWVAAMNQYADPILIRRVADDKEFRLLFLVHLPICHVYGRSADYHTGGLMEGGVLAFEPDFGKIPKTLREVRPSVIISIPRFFEKVYDQITSIAKRQPPLLRSVFNWAMRQGEKFADAMAKGERLNMFDLTMFAAANILVFNKIREQAGLDRLVMAVSGGGKLSKEVCSFIRSLGVQLSEGYGLTETCASLNYNAPEFSGIDRDKLSWFQNKMIDWTYDVMIKQQAAGKSPYTNPLRTLKLSVAYNAIAYRLQVKSGSVGRPVALTQEIIAEDGEILAKGPQIFQGYWKMPKETKESFNDDGWFLTGDIGRFDKDGFLEITDRKKELFVTSGGKNVAPHPIELAITGRPCIEQACLIGDGQKYLTALIVPDFQELRRHLKGKGIAVDTTEAMIARDDIKAMIDEQIKEVNKQLARYEQIKYYIVLPKPFTVEDGELTPTLKLKRRIIKERYEKEIKRMYSVQTSRDSGDQAPASA